MKKVLLSGSLVTTLALAALGCGETTTEPLPDLSIGDAQASGDSGSTTPQDTSGTTSTPPDTTAAPGDSTSTDPAAADVVTLYASSQSGVQEAGQQIIENADAWAAAWSELHANVTPEPAVPDVDFTARRVVLVTAGERPNGGHRFELVEVTSGDAGSTVHVNDVVPGPSCLTAQVISYPALAISIARTGDAPVILVERVYDDCG
jgi:hypothetical protein